MKQLKKINLIKKLKPLDLLLVLVIGIVLIVTLIFFSRKKSVVYMRTIDVPQAQTASTASYGWVANSIHKGDTVFGPSGSKDAEVIDVDNVDWGGQLRTARLTLKVYTLYDKRTKQYRLRDNVLQVGNVIALNIQNSNYKGMITYLGDTMDPPGSQYKYVNLLLRAYSVEPWLAETYKKPFEVVNTEGKEIFKIISADVHAAENSVPTATGQLVRSGDPYKRDVDITAKVLVRCQTDVCYFNEVFPVKVGLSLWTQSPTSIIEGATRIMKISDWVDTTK